MPSHPSKPKTLAGDPGLATAGGTPALQDPLRLRSGQAFDFVRLASHSAQDDNSKKVAGLFASGCRGAGEFVPLARGHLDCWSNGFDYGRAL
jgi:hypothetical protein